MSENKLDPALVAALKSVLVDNGTAGNINFEKIQFVSILAIVDSDDGENYQLVSIGSGSLNAGLDAYSKAFVATAGKMAERASNFLEVVQQTMFAASIISDMRGALGDAMRNSIRANITKAASSEAPEMKSDVAVMHDEVQVEKPAGDSGAGAASGEAGPN